MMGYSQDTNCCIDPKGEEAHRLQNGYVGVSRNKPISSSTSSSLIIGENRKEIDFEVVSLLQKMVWELGLRCVLPGAAKVRLQQNVKKKVEQESGNEEGSEHNKAWLLAESSAVVVVDDDAEFTSDPQSVHSSFRFSFGSQIEFDALCLNSSSSGATTVLMVNLDNGLRESQSKDLKWRRMESLERSISPVADTLTRYSYAEIRSATQNFYKGRVLGRGALSCVFRGRVGFRRTSVAIKRLDKEDNECSKAFVRELMIASSLDNRNIVPLIGFCIDPDEGLFLVYKYVSGGSLEHHLHEKKKKGIRGRSSLSCSVRFKIAIGIAEAVAYLHNGTERCVVHRDIKPSNILLSSKKTPKLCDFGLATWTDAPSVPFLCKTVKGTFGYLAPEYFQHGKVSDKTDVYAFGVVLLELITGRKPIETKRESGDENLVLWAKPLLEQGSRAIGELVDPKLKLRPHNSRQVTQMVEAASACINSEESRRPSIDEVISILRGEEHNSSPNKNKSSFSGCLTDCYAQSNDLQTKSDLKSHLALAMLGVSDLEDDDHLYSR